MDEYHGAMGIAPGPYSWHRYERMFLGWRRQQAMFTAQIWSAVLRAMGADVMPHHMSDLVPHVVEPPPVAPGGMEVLKALVERGVVS